jgi:hypothetical protein
MYDNWGRTYLEAQIWHCGDEICNCYQPQIDEISPNCSAGYPWIRRKEIWRGTFCSDPSHEEYEAMIRELTEKAKNLGVPEPSPI